MVEAAAWGLFGSFAVEGLELVAAIRRTAGGWPWRRDDFPGIGPYVVSIFVRFAVGAGLAAATTTSGNTIGALGALSVGIAAPLIIEKLASQARQTYPHETPPTAANVVKTSDPKAAGASGEI